MPVDCHVSKSDIALHGVKADPAFNYAVCLRVPTRMQASACAVEMYHGQPLALKVTPVHAGFILVFLTAAGRVDAGDLHLEADQSNR